MGGNRHWISRMRAILPVSAQTVRALQTSHEEALHSLRKTQESLTTTQDSLTRTQESLRETQIAASQLAEAFSRLSQRYEQSTQEVEQVLALQAHVRILASALHDMRSQPLETSPAPVTVVIPTCDRPRHLRRALESLTRQVRKPSEVIIVNDGHADVDGVVSGFRSYPPRVVLLESPAARSGQSSALNAALDAATNPVITYLDDDNEMWSHWTAAVAEFFEQHPSVDAVYGAQLRLDIAAPSGVLFRPEHSYEALRHANYIDTGILAHRATRIRWSAGTHRFNDWEFALNLAQDHAVSPLPRLASLYDASQPDRLSSGRNWRLLRDAVVQKHGRPEDERFVCALCQYTASHPPDGQAIMDAECPNCQSLSHHRLLALLLPLLSQRLLSGAGGTVLGIAPFGSAEVLFRHHGLTLMELDRQWGGSHPGIAVVGQPEELPVRSASIPAVLLADEWQTADPSMVVHEACRVTAKDGLALLPLSAAGRRPPESQSATLPDRAGESAELCASAGLRAHRAIARQLIPGQLLTTYAIDPNAGYLLCHPEADCGPGCWIQAVLNDQESLAEQLSVYLKRQPGT